MADEGENYVSTEVCDVLESISFLNVEGKSSPLESTVLSNTDEQQVWIGFIRCLLVMLGIFFFFFGGFGEFFKALIPTNIYLVRTAVPLCP